MELNNLEVGENMQVNWHTVERLMNEKEGPDALILWFRYYRQRLIQGQQLTYSTDKFMMNWTGWSKVRFYKAKNLLIKLGMIDVIQKRDKNKITGWYVRVNYTFNPETVRNHSIIYEMEEKDQSEPLESLNGRIFETKNLQNERQIQPNNKEIQPNNKINTYSSENEDFTLVVNRGTYLNNIGALSEIEEHPQAPVEELNFYKKEDPYVQSMMKNKNFDKNNQEAILKLSKLGYNWDTLKTVCAFIVQDDFWSKQIRSLSKLLKKNPDGVMYIDVMIDKIKQRKPKVIDLDNLY